MMAQKYDVLLKGGHVVDPTQNLDGTFDVAVVGGIVGVLGGLGGFVLPIVFGYMLKGTGIWTTTWMLLAVITVVSLVWMQWVIQRMTQQRDPELYRTFDHGNLSVGEGKD